MRNRLAKFFRVPAISDGKDLAGRKVSVGTGGFYPRSSRSAWLAAWIISLLVHGVIAGAFLIGYSSSASTADKERPVPRSIIERSAQPLKVMPPAADLEIEPLTGEDAIPLEKINQDLPLPTAPQPDRLTAPDIAVFTGQKAGLPVAASTRQVSSRYRSSFCGTEATAPTICYVVDCSGSMVIAFDYVKRELRSAVRHLSPAHYFHLIYYAGGSPIEMPDRCLIRASSPNRDKALSFIDRVTLAQVKDSTAAWQAVVAALESAFRVTTPGGEKGQVIYFLTDGQYDHQQVFDAVRKLQRQREKPAVFNVIACGIRDNEKFLRKLAIANQGQFRFVSDEEMARPAGKMP